MGWLSAETGWEFQAVPKDIIAAAEEQAKREIKEADMEDDDSDDDDQ